MKKNKKIRISPETISLPCCGVDSHAHLSLKNFQNNLNQVLKRANRCGVQYIGNVFLSCDEFIKNVNNLKNKNIFFILGIHPHDGQKLGVKEIEKIRQICLEYDIKAIGEIGLDYYYNFSEPKIQQKIFEYQINLALELNKPIVIHSREAKEDTFAILNNFKKINKCLFHCFSYGKSEIRKILDQGWSVSFSGAITFKKSQELQEIAKYTPIRHILLETDCPYLTPEPYRGKKNEPAFIVFSAYKLAFLKKKNVIDIWYYTGQNAKKFFNII
ncbi:MAG: TatD family hydrolase [Desulfonauticus sp.]|nr:TatD family hydrolase [Desulfonauticus sp.]